MYYVVQEKLFREENYENLIHTLERLGLEYEIVKITSSDSDINLKTDRKDIFPFGGVKMAKIAKKYNWNPGSFMTDNHDYELYSKYYKDNLLNYDSKIMKVKDVKDYKFFFARPTKDTKAFTGRTFDEYEWEEFKETYLNNPRSILTEDTMVQIASIKHILKEIRFWIVKGKIITASVYNMGGYYYLGNLTFIDKDAYDFVNKMINIYQLADTFVMDICLTENGYKIVECNCTNCSGFYMADMNKLIISLEEAFN